jgi:hypothetical protein
LPKQVDKKTDLKKKERINCFFLEEPNAHSNVFMRKTSIKKDKWILFFLGGGYDTRVTTLKVLRNQVNTNNINFILGYKHSPQSFNF